MKNQHRISHRRWIGAAAAAAISLAVATSAPDGASAAPRAEHAATHAPGVRATSGPIEVHSNLSIRW